MFAELLKGYSDHLRAAVPRSVYHYRSHARTFLRWLAAKNVPLAQVAANQVNDYLCHRRSSGRQASTLKNDLCKVRHFFRYARQEGLISHDPTEEVSFHWLKAPGGYPAYRGVLARALSCHPSFLFGYRLPLFAPEWEEFLGRLLEQRYTRLAILGIARYNRDFHRHLVRAHVRRVEQITPTYLENFVARMGHRFERRHGRQPSRQFLNKCRGSVDLFLKFAFARRNRVFGKARAQSRSQALPDDLLDRYLAFCQSHRGLKTSTLESHHYVLAKLRRFLGRRKIKRIEAASIADYDRFLLDCSKSLSHNSLFSVLGVLRSFLRYLYVEEAIPSDLARDLISPRHFSAELRPKYLPWSKIEQLLAGIERESIVGKRDHAILILLACHGLRAREVAKLVLSDIDWAAPALLLRDQKNGATSKIPLSPRAKEALERYLAVRPDSPFAEVFLTVRAPIKPLGDNLYSVAHFHLKKRFGRLLPAQGSHLLRHSFAKLLLDRKARLQDVMLLLRHKSLNSTQPYTRIATEDLREVADNYANLLVGQRADAPGSATTPT